MNAAPDYVIDDTARALILSAAKLQLERDEMAGALRDIAYGMQMQLDSGVWSGAALGLIKEVKRVAEGGLREGSVS